MARGLGRTRTLRVNLEDIPECEFDPDPSKTSRFYPINKIKAAEDNSQRRVDMWLKGASKFDFVHIYHILMHLEQGRYCSHTQTSSIPAVIPSPSICSRTCQRQKSIAPNSWKDSKLWVKIHRLLCLSQFVSS